MRITDNMRLLSTMRSNERVQGRLTETSRRAALGARVVVPSDDPVAYATTVRRGSAGALLTSRITTARDASDELSIAERSLDSATNLVEEARSLAIQGANETLNATDRKALAVRVRGLRDQLLEIANTRGSRGYLFAGTRTNVAPFTAGGAFVGNDGALNIPITDGVAPRGNASGARAFTAAGGRNIFADLTTLATALDANNVATVRSSIDSFATAHAQVIKVQVEVGLSMEQFQSAADVMEESSIAIAASRARAAGADDTIGIASDFATASSAYQQSLEATRRLLALPSLASR